MLATSAQRTVKGLKWAQLQERSPFPKTRPRASALKRGLAFERGVGRRLWRMVDAGELRGDLRLGQWIMFADREGISYAQPDAYLITPTLALLMECKLTQSDSAEAQMQSLYLPLLQHLYELPIVCLQVCKNLRYVPEKLIESPAALLGKPRPGTFTWHLFD